MGENNPNETGEKDRLSLAVEGMTGDSLKGQFNNWTIINGFICRTCHELARHHPADTGVWGCNTCGLVTCSVSLYFVPNESCPSNTG